MTDLLTTLGLAKGGDQSSLRELISRFQADVRGVCFDVRIDGADLSYSDLQQEVWLRVWCKLDQFVGSPDEQVCLAMFRRWLRTTSRNVMLNIIKSRHADCRRPRTRPISLSELNRGGCVEPDDSATPSRCVSEREEALRVRAAIAAIDCPHSRRIVELRFLENRTLHEITDELGLTYDQVRERCAKGMTQFESLFLGKFSGNRMTRIATILTTVERATLIDLNDGICIWIEGSLDPDDIALVLKHGCQTQPKLPNAVGQQFEYFVEKNTFTNRFELGLGNSGNAIPTFSTRYCSGTCQPDFKSCKYPEHPYCDANKLLDCK